MEDPITYEKSDPCVTMELILSVFKSYSDRKKIKDIKAAVLAELHPEDVFAQPAIEECIENIIRADKKQGNESFLCYSKGYYTKRKKKTIPPDTILQASSYVGAAGECAVMSELLFNNYNVNRMMIDDGVDLVASKENAFYYIQVKTVSVKNGRIIAQIPIDTFDRHDNSQMRFIIVARYGEQSGLRNMFFMFTHQEVAKAIYDKCIKRGDQNIVIKIKFHERSGDPILYDETEVSAKWHLNNFKL